MIVFKPTLPTHRHYCFLHFVFVLFMLVTKEPQLIKASTLVIEGYDLVELSRDRSTLATGFQSPINSVGNGCSWNTYYESCYGYGGTIVFYSKSRGTSYSINGKIVTYCSRYKQVSFCTSNGLSTTSTRYGGVKITYNLVANTGKVAAVSISNERSDACRGVCTDTNGQLSFPIDSKSSCDSYTGGWAAVNDNYQDTCAPPKQTCSELVISKGCEDSVTHIVGTYRPTSACSGREDPDQTRSIYYSSNVDKYLFYRSSSDDWVFSPSCSDFFVRAYLDAGDEPYLNAANEVLCYDGGFTSNKKYTYTNLMMKCNKISSPDGSGSSSSTSGSREPSISRPSISSPPSSREPSISRPSISSPPSSREPSISRPSISSISPSSRKPSDSPSSRKPSDSPSSRKPSDSPSSMKLSSSPSSSSDSSSVSSSGSAAGSSKFVEGDGNEGTVVWIVVGFFVITGFVSSIFIVIKKRRRNMSRTMMISSKRKTGGVPGAASGTSESREQAPLAQPVFPVTPAQEVLGGVEEVTAIPVAFSAGYSTAQQEKTPSSPLVLQTAPVPVAPPLVAFEQETTFTPIAPPPSQTANEDQVEEGGGESVAKTNTIYRRLEDLEKMKPLLTKKEYKMKRMAILGDL